MHALFVLVGVQHAVRRQDTLVIEVEADAEHHGVRPPHDLAGQMRVPEVAVTEVRTVLAVPVFGAPGQGLGAPQVGQMIGPLVPCPVVEGLGEKVVLDAVGRHPVHIERPQYVGVSPLRRLRYGRADQVDPVAVDGQDLVEQLAVSAVREMADLDARFLLEALNDATRKLPRSHHQAEVTRRGMGVPDDPGTDRGDGCRGRDRFQEPAAA